MKFEDIIFKDHPELLGKEAKVFFPNGFGAHIAGGPDFGGDGTNTFEITVLKGTEDMATPCLFNVLCDFSIPDATKSDVEHILYDISTFIPE